MTLNPRIPFLVIVHAIGPILLGLWLYAKVVHSYSQPWGPFYTWGVGVVSMFLPVIAGGIVAGRNGFGSASAWVTITASFAAIFISAFMLGVM